MKSCGKCYERKIKYVMRGYERKICFVKVAFEIPSMSRNLGQERSAIWGAMMAERITRLMS